MKKEFSMLTMSLMMLGGLSEWGYSSSRTYPLSDAERRLLVHPERMSKKRKAILKKQSKTP